MVPCDNVLLIPVMKDGKQVEKPDGTLKFKERKCKHMNDPTAKRCGNVKCKGELRTVTWQCPKCKKNDIPNGVHVCPECGFERPARQQIVGGMSMPPEEVKLRKQGKRTCPHCGEEVDLDWILCPFCDKTLK